MSDPLDLDIPPLDGLRPVRTLEAPCASPSGNGNRAPQAETQPAGQKRATRGFNLLIWRGRLAADPEVREAATGSHFLRVRCLQDQPDRNGQPGVQGVEIALFAERADQFSAYFRRGDEVLVKGRLTIETKPDKQGVARTTASLYPDGSVELIHRPGSQSSAIPINRIRDLLESMLGAQRTAEVITALRGTAA